MNLTTWHNLLQEYVNDSGQVDYQRWQVENATTLFQWLTQLSTIDLTTLESEELLAFWLNLYNALTIAEILKAYPIDSIFPKVWGIPNLFSFWAFFQRQIWSNRGYNYSLNQIEHSELRKKFPDPRIHFALVCASVGCPWLRREAYTPETVEIQLSEDAHRFINNPVKVRYLSTENCLYLSMIFRWYRQDFEKVAPSVREYVQTYLDIPLSESITIGYLSYDWSLNQRIS